MTLVEDGPAGARRADGTRGATADAAPVGRLIDQFELGLDAPICLTWELTYACNLACVHCLSSSGRRDPAELTPEEARHVVDEMVDLKVFYVYSLTSGLLSLCVYLYAVTLLNDHPHSWCERSSTMSRPSRAP